MSRPPLPTAWANANLTALQDGQNLPPVKYQILHCQGKDILVARLKIETPTETGHAFILRRYDTGAVSLTTMFRAAFPACPEELEKEEVSWVRESFDLTGNNGSSKDTSITRLAGVWVGTDLALELARDYNLAPLIQLVVDATPDPSANYRRSGKKDATSIAQKVASPAKPPSTSAAKSLPTPSPTGPIGPPAAKRRKESSPAPSSSSAAPSVKPPSRTSPATPAKATSTPRRSARSTKSPAPRVAPLSSIASSSKTTPKTRSLARTNVVAASSTVIIDSELQPVDEEESTINVVAGDELWKSDVREQQTLIANLKAARAKRDVREEEEEEEEERGDMDVEGSSSDARKKRSREDVEAPLQFDFKEPENEERAIITNRRVATWTPQSKSVAWGLAAFAVGMGAISFLPNLF